MARRTGRAKDPAMDDIPPVCDAPSARTSRGEQALATKALLARTALALFAERGYAATSTRMIAKAAGISEGLIFHHYPTKLDLLLGVAAHHDVLAGRIQRLLADAEHLPVAAMVRGVTSGFVTMMTPDRQETRLFRVLIGESLTTPELHAVFLSTSQAVIDAIAGYLRGRVEHGELRAELPAETAACSLLGPLLWFFMTHQQLSADEWQAQAHDYAREVAGHWLRGALAQPATP